MAPTASTPAEGAPIPGPHPSHINVAKPYLFQQQIQSQLVAIGANPTREDTFRLQGVQFVHDIRVALQLPVRTFSTAICYYHKFRLSHKDSEYQYQDAAAAALLTACKIEDTLKKSREILCAAFNLKVSPSEHLNTDDSSFDGPAKVVVGHERLMLESSSFDFRSRHPHKHLIKLAKDAVVDKDVTKVAYNIMLDLYRTFAPLKQTCATMAFACIELATVILNKQQEMIRGENAPSYEKWHTTRSEIMETLLDLLDLYTHFHKSSIAGPTQLIERFINIKIKLNQEMEESKSLDRYTEYHETPKVNGFKHNVKTPKTPITPASPSDARPNGKDGTSPTTLSPRSSSSGRRGYKADGTARFMLDAEQAKQEKEVVNQYFKVEYEEYEVEIEETVKQDKHSEQGTRPIPVLHQNPRDGFDRYPGPNKRLRR